MVQGGVVAAFGLVRGSAQADMLQLSVGNPFTPQLLAQVRYKALGIKQLLFCSPHHSLSCTHIGSKAYTFA